LSLSRETFAGWLADDERAAFACERLPERERVTRRIAPPATNLGTSRGRFWELMVRLADDVRTGRDIIDFGAYPGTTLRLARRLPGGGGDARLAAAGFGIDRDFSEALEALDATFLKMEFDVRRPPDESATHILTRPVPPEDAFDVAVCTEVIEHQMYPLSLLVGVNRFLRTGGVMYLTTNSVSFIGDIVKLASRRHNVEALNRSHVLSDSAWRPHIRLYTLGELTRLCELAGFAVEEGFYFDNGNVYAGAKGLAVSVARGLARAVPHLRSHIWLTARKRTSPSSDALSALRRSASVYGLTDELGLGEGLTA
jgi:SAM-dependent methyltransferase